MAGTQPRPTTLIKKMNMASDGMVKTTDQNPVTASTMLSYFQINKPVMIAVTETMPITIKINSICDQIAASIFTCCNLMNCNRFGGFIGTNSTPRVLT